MADFAKPTVGSVKSIPGPRPSGAPLPKPANPDGHADFQAKREHVGQDEVTLYSSLLATNQGLWKTWVQKLVKNPRR